MRDSRGQRRKRTYDLRFKRRGSGFQRQGKDAKALETATDGEKAALPQKSTKFTKVNRIRPASFPSLWSLCSFVAKNSSRLCPPSAVSAGRASPSEGLLRRTGFLALRALWLEFVEEPRPGMGPVVVGGALRDAENFGSFLERHAHEVMQLHQFGFGLVLGGKLVERLVDGQELVIVTRRGHIYVLNIHALPAAAVAKGAFAAGFLNQDAAHGLGGGGEKMRAVCKLRLFVAGQAKPSFVNQRRGLERLTRRFVGHLRRRELAQLLIHQREQFVGGVGVALLDGRQDMSDVAHARRPTRFRPAAPDHWAF